MHLVNRHDTAQLRLDLLDHLRGAGGDHGDAAEVSGVIDFGDGQAFDVVAAAGEQADDTGQNAGFVFNQQRQRVTFLYVRKRGP